MTRHRAREEWISDILEAAKCEIDEKGYADFSMEAIVRRTGLSKGGIYRFFGNRSDVALELFAGCYRTLSEFDMDECVAWNLSLSETVFRLFGRYSMPENAARRADRLWVRLLPEVLNDRRFADTRARLIEEITSRFMELAVAVSRRDHVTLPEDLTQRMPDIFALGVGMMEGFALQSALGSSIADQGRLVRSFFADLEAELVRAQ